MFWNEGSWQPPTCHEGVCYMGQTYNECTGKGNGHPVGDGTWCWEEKRYTKCPTDKGRVSWYKR